MFLCLISQLSEVCEVSEHQIKFQRKWAVSRPLVRLPVAPRCYIYCTLIVPGWRVSSESNSCNFKHNLFLLWFSIIITNIHTKNFKQSTHYLYDWQSSSIYINIKCVYGKKKMELIGPNAAFVFARLVCYIIWLATATTNTATPSSVLAPGYQINK